MGPMHIEYDSRNVKPMAIVRGLRCASLRLKASMYHLNNLVYCLVRSIFGSICTLGFYAANPTFLPGTRRNPGVQDLRVSGMGYLQN